MSRTFHKVDFEFGTTQFHYLREASPEQKQDHVELQPDRREHANYVFLHNLVLIILHLDVVAPMSPVTRFSITSMHYLINKQYFAQHTLFFMRKR